MKFEALRTQGVQPSETLASFEKVKRLKQAGMDIINLMGGKRGDTPQNIKEATKKALDQGMGTAITDTAGLAELREAIAVKLGRENGIEADPKSEIAATVGTKEAFFCSIFATINPGDEVMIIDPSWVSYKQIVQLAGGIPIDVSLDEEDWSLSYEELEKKVSPRTKMIMINTPHNPTGTAFDKDAIESIADVARRHDLLVTVDEIYEKIIYDGRRHFSIASFPGMKERTISVFGLSYMYNMAGFRMGYAAADKEIMRRMLNVHSHSVTCPCSFAQRGALEAITGPQDFVINVREKSQEQRDYMISKLNKIEGVSCTTPKGGFLCFPNVSKIGLSSVEFAEYLLWKAGVATMPGSMFGARGEGHLRLSFTNPKEIVDEGIKRIEEALEKINAAT